MRIVVGRARGLAGADTLEALKRLGPEVELAVGRGAGGALRLVRDQVPDLVILEEGGSGATWRALEALREAGPPVIVVTVEGDARRALEAFRRGAADCVARGPDYADVLPVVALEQIRRWRAGQARRAAEHRIRRLEELNDAIVRQIPAALAVLDGARRLVAVNPAFTRAFGVDAVEAAGRPLAEALPPELLESGGVGELLEQAAAGAAPAPRLARAPGAADSPRAFDVRAQRLDDGRLLLVLSEVTERETLARRVENLRRYNENIIQNMNSALIVVDSDGRIVFCNPTAERILGAPPGGLVGRPFPGPAQEADLLQRTLREGVRLRGAETLVTRADGRSVPIGVSCAPLLDADGRANGAVAIFQDLSEIKELQQQVLQSEKMAAIGQLAAGVAHEINNPMGFIHANLSQMEEYLADLDRLWPHVDAVLRTGEEAEPQALRDVSRALCAAAREIDAPFVFADLGKAVRESQEGSQRIRQIVKDLREFSHQGGDERELADVNQCLDTTANIVASMMKHVARLERDYGELPPLLCHPGQLKQVFMNLLVNACQAIEERGAGESGCVRLRTRRCGDAISVSVADDGVGIARAHLERIFEPFFTTKQVGVGTGLGLSMAFQIVRRHGGSIRVESEPGRGSRFEVLLPVAGGSLPAR